MKGREWNFRVLCLFDLPSAEAGLEEEEGEKKSWHWLVASPWLLNPIWYQKESQNKQVQVWRRIFDGWAVGWLAVWITLLRKGIPAQDLFTHLGFDSVELENNFQCWTGFRSIFRYRKLEGQHTACKKRVNEIFWVLWKLRNMSKKALGSVGHSPASENQAKIFCDQKTVTASVPAARSTLTVSRVRVCVHTSRAKRRPWDSNGDRGANFGREPDSIGLDCAGAITQWVSVWLWFVEKMPGKLTEKKSTFAATHFLRVRHHKRARNRAKNGWQTKMGKMSSSSTCPDLRTQFHDHKLNQFIDGFSVIGTLVASSGILVHIDFACHHQTSDLTDWSPVWFISFRAKHCPHWNGRQAGPSSRHIWGRLFSTKPESPPNPSPTLLLRF